MKKLIALLLTLVMLFSLSACSLPFGECMDGHVDEDGNLICDICGREIDEEDPENNGNPDDPSDDSYLAPTISEAIMAQLKEAGSMTIDLTLSLESFSSYYIGDGDENSENPEREEDLVKGDVLVSFTISKTERGFDAMIYAKSVDTSEEEPDVEEERFYLIDGKAYYRDAELDGYVEVLIPEFDSLMNGNLESAPAAIVESISQLIDGLELSEDEKKSLEESIGLIITELFEIKNFEGALNVNYKTYIDEFFAYVDGLDSSTKTLESLVDDILHLADEELSFAKLIAEMERVAKLTLSEGLTEIDASLTENYDTTLQGIYDTVVCDERFEQVIRMYLESMSTPNGEELTEDDVQAFLTEIRAIKVIDVIKSYYPDLDAITVYDAIMPILEMLMAGSEPEATEPISDTESDIPPVNAFFGAIKDFFAMTVADAAKEYGMPDFIATLKDAIAGIKVNALSTSASISFSESFAVTEINLGLKVDIETETPTGFDETLFEENDVKVDLSFKISAISNDTVEIAIPEDEKIIFGIWNSVQFFNDEDGVFSGLNLYLSDKDTPGSYCIYGEAYAAGGHIEMIGEIDPFAGRQDTYTFTGTYYSYVDYTHADVALSITFDYEAFTYKITFTAQ